MENFSLSNPPIREAVIELKFSTARSFTINDAEKVAESLVDRYPKKEKSVSFRVNKKPDKIEVSELADGFRLIDPDRPFVVIIKLNSLIVSHLKPYSSFENLKSEFTYVLKKLLEVAALTKINRLGIRYINEFSFSPKSGLQVTDYIKIQPHVAGVRESNLLGYSMRLNPYHETKRLIIQVVVEPDQSNADQHKIVFDIDAFHEEEIPYSYGTLSSILDELRMLKNETFRTNIGHKALEIFKPYDANR